MKSKSNIITGVLLIIIGFLLLADIQNWFQIKDLIKILAPFWPLGLIAAGVAVFFDQTRKVFNPLTVVLIVFTIILAIYHGTTEVIHKVKNEFSEGLDIDMFNENRDSSSSNNFRVFSVDKTNEIRKAKLDFEGGAAEFNLKPIQNNHIFEGKLSTKGMSYLLNEEKIQDTQNIQFKMDDNNNIHINSHNQVDMGLNKDIDWDLNFEIGAGDINFDFSPFNVKKVTIKTGAADLDLKFGELSKSTEVNIESGVANLNIKVPKSVACIIEMDGTLNAKDFEGFEKIEKNKYQTKNANKTTSKTIFLKLESALSNIEVERY